MATKRKAKFKEGQVVTYRHGSYRHQWRPFFQLGSFDEGSLVPAWYTQNGWLLECILRPITKKEYRG